VDTSTIFISSPKLPVPLLVSVATFGFSAYTITTASFPLAYVVTAVAVAPN